MAQWKIDSLGIDSATMDTHNNHDAILSVYGSQWRFATDDAHKNIVAPEAVKEIPELTRIKMNADPYSPELLRALPTEQLKFIAGSVGIAKISDSREKLILSILEKVGSRISEKDVELAAKENTEIASAETTLSNEEKIYLESLEIMDMDALKDIAAGLGVLKPSHVKGKLLEQIMAKRG